MALGAERFVAIHLHLRYQELVTHKRVVVLATIVWAVSALLSLITSLWPSIGKKIVAVFFGFCFICSLIFYRKIYSTVRRHTNQIQALQVHDGEMAVNVAKIKRSGLCTCYVYVLFCCVTCLIAVDLLQIYLSLNQILRMLIFFGILSHWCLLIHH